MQDGQPPLGWHDTVAYLVLPVLLVVSQYVSMELMKPPQVNHNPLKKKNFFSLLNFLSKHFQDLIVFYWQTDDPTQKNTLLVFKFLPLMIGYFSLSVPSGLSIYWLVSHCQFHLSLPVSIYML